MVGRLGRWHSLSENLVSGGSLAVEGTAKETRPGQTQGFRQDYREHCMGVKMSLYLLHRRGISWRFQFFILYHNFQIQKNLKSTGQVNKTSKASSLTCKQESVYCCCLCVFVREYMVQTCICTGVGMSMFGYTHVHMCVECPHFIF